MSEPHFVRIDREHPHGEKHYVVHAHDPRFTLELTPEVDAQGRIVAGTLKRVCVPNTWTADRGRYAALLTKAHEFFARSCAEAPRRPARFESPE